MARKKLNGRLWFAVASIILVVMSQTSLAQNPVRIIELKPVKDLFLPKEFYIKKVVDARKNRETIGFLITATSPQELKKPLNLKEGVESALNDFIIQSLPRRSSLRPIIFSLRELQVVETVQSEGMVSGELRLSVAFEIDKGIEPVKLVEYKGGTRYSRSIDPQFDIGPIVSKNINTALEYFNNWITREAPSDESLAKELKISFTEFRSDLNSDTLFYESSRPLAWSDFKSRPDFKSRFSAEVFPSFAFEESKKIVNSVVEVDVKLKIYLVRSFSWVKAYARNAYTLNHEQRHFDIVKIAAERFKKKLREEELTVDNYQGILSMEYLQCLRDLNDIQEQYDSETSHGTDQATQEKWNRRIDQELKAYKSLSSNQEN